MHYYFLFYCFYVNVLKRSDFLTSHPVYAASFNTYEFIPELNLIFIKSLVLRFSLWITVTSRCSLRDIMNN
jgi:hypothetical protein